MRAFRSIEKGYSMSLPKNVDLTNPEGSKVFSNLQLESFLNALRVFKKSLSFLDNLLEIGFSLSTVKQYWMICIGSKNEMKDINLWPDEAKDFSCAVSHHRDHICRAVEIWAGDIGEHGQEKRDDILAWLDDVLIAGHFHPGMSLSMRIPKIIASVHECA